jgi:hypothetical protein
MRLVVGALIWMLALPPLWVGLALGDEGAPVSIGHIPTPRGNSVKAWNSTYLAVALFEQLSTEVEVDVIERGGAGAVHKLVVPDSYIVYSLVFDKTNQDVLWIATSQKGALFKANVLSGAITKVAEFGDTKYIFAAAQHPNGDIYLGTFPDAKVYRISAVDGSYKTEEISSISGLVAARTNVTDVFIPDNGLVFFHIGSPGTLIGYDPVTGKSATILDTSEPFLYPVRDVIKPISEIRSADDFRLYKPGGMEGMKSAPSWAARLFWPDVYRVKDDGFDLVVSHDGRETRISEMPRHEGMPITAFRKVSDDLAVGGTYWNQWFFKVDLRTLEIKPLGQIGRTGEFFAACGFDGKVIIPHYLGLLLEWDPNRPLQRPKEITGVRQADTITYARGDNPRELVARSDGHVGVDCLDAGNGKVIYTTAPTYGQETGRLWLVDVRPDEQGETKVERVHAPPQTIGRLALSHGRLFGGTIEARGLGLRPLATQPPLRVVELDPKTFDEMRSVELPVDKFRNTTGLIPIADHHLLIGIEGGGLYLVDTSAESLQARRIGPACAGVSALASLSSDTAVALCASHVFVVDGRSGDISEAAAFNKETTFMVACPNDDVIVTSKSELIRIPAAAIHKAQQQIAHN